MQQMMFLFPLLLGLVMLLGATIAILRRLSKGEKPMWIRALVVAASLGLAFIMYKGIYKPFGLYENHFTQATGVQFPTSGEYLFADTWSDNAESDGFSSISLVSLPSDEIEEFLRNNGNWTAGMYRRVRVDSNCLIAIKIKKGVIYLE